MKEKHHSHALEFFFRLSKSNTVQIPIIHRPQCFMSNDHFFDLKRRVHTVEVQILSYLSNVVARHEEFFRWIPRKWTGLRFEEELRCDRRRAIDLYIDRRIHRLILFASGLDFDRVFHGYRSNESNALWLIVWSFSPTGLFRRKEFYWSFSVMFRRIQPSIGNESTWEGRTTKVFKVIPAHRT